MVAQVDCQRSGSAGEVQTPLDVVLRTAVRRHALRRARGRVVQATPVPSPPKELLAALGITRLARLTALDRLGVEVVTAVRPRGHVLQVTTGKGRTLPRAQWSAVGEAAELSAAESPSEDVLRFTSASRLDGLVLDDDGLTRAWVRGRRLLDGAPVWVAAERVYCPPAQGPWLGPSTSSWTSNGLGAHRRPGLATTHAVLEVWERHALARALPGGFTARALKATVVDWRGAPRQRLEAAGLLVVPCLLATRPLPLAAVLLVDAASEVVPLSAGYACRRSLAQALEAAALEAAQSRLTDIHGGREDVAVSATRPVGQAVRPLLQRLRPRRVPRAGQVRAWPAAVASRVVVVTLRRQPLHVVKAIGIGLQESGLLR